jgi:hypothetical protein
MKLSEVIGAAMKRGGIENQTALAAKMSADGLGGVRQPNVSCWTLDKIDPSPVMLGRLAAACGVEIVIRGPAEFDVISAQD